LANGMVGGFTSPILGRPRGIFTAGVEEPNAFVEITHPWFEPIVAATTVELVDGLVASSRPGVGALPVEPSPTKPTLHRYAHADSVVIQAPPRFLVAVAYTAAQSQQDAAPDGSRPLMLLDASRTPPSTFHQAFNVLPKTTTLGLYDDGYVVA